MLELGALVFACASPERLCEVWAAVLGYAREGDSAVDPSGEVPRLVFREAAKTPTIEVPIHLDVNVPDADTEVARLLGLGARRRARSLAPERDQNPAEGPDRDHREHAERDGETARHGAHY